MCGLLLFVGVGCSLFLVCCSLSGVRCLLFVVCCLSMLLFVDGVVCGLLLFVVRCCSLFVVVSWPLRVVCCVLNVVRC